MVLNAIILSTAHSIYKYELIFLWKQGGIYAQKLKKKKILSYHMKNTELYINRKQYWHLYIYNPSKPYKHGFVSCYSIQTFMVIGILSVNFYSDQTDSI